MAAALEEAERQGLTLVHFLAQRKHSLRDSLHRLSILQLNVLWDFAGYCGTSLVGVSLTVTRTSQLS